jgi:carboxylesterase
LTDLREVYAVRGARRDQVQPFAFDRGPIGCVLLHGFTAAPKEMRPLGEYLAQRNYTVRGVRYPGHGTCPEDLARSTWREWVASAQSAADELRAPGRQVWSIGLSLGGLISLYLAEHDQVDGVVALAPPILTYDRRLPFARFIWRFKHYSPKSLADLRDPAALAQHADYDRFPTRSVAELYALMRRVRRDLQRVRVPLLLIHAQHDQVVSSAGAGYIWQRVSSTDKESVILERGGHIITEDFDKDVAFAHIHHFLQGHTVKRKA